MTRAGHEVVVFEANKQAGGRLFTYDTGKTIIELGGMRLPLDIHTLADTYLRKRFNLPIEPFISSDPNTFVYINGFRYRAANTSFLPSEYNMQVAANEQNKVGSYEAIFIISYRKVLYNKMSFFLVTI